MSKIIDLDKHRPVPTIPDDAQVIYCDYCEGTEYFIDCHLDAWCSSCLRLALEGDLSYEIEVELDYDD